MLSVSNPESKISFAYRFNPTKEEILLSLLRPAINGEPLSSALVIKADIYGENKEPWKIFDKAANNSFWVFTKLKKKSRLRIDRTAGCGCWLGRCNKEIKNAHGQLIGFDKYFTFTCKKDQSSQGNGHWIMHEYSLSDEGSSDYVICEIKNKDSAVSVGLNHQEDEVDTKNKKRRTLDVVDEEMSVPSLKKVCADDESSPKEIQRNEDGWTANRLQQTMTNISYVAVGLNHEENDDTKNKKRRTQEAVDEDMSVASLRKVCADVLNATIDQQNSGELDHPQTTLEDIDGFHNRHNEVLTSEDPSVPAQSSLESTHDSLFQRIYQDLLNCISQSTDSGEPDHRGRQTTHEDTEADLDMDGFADWLNEDLTSNL